MSTKVTIKHYDESTEIGMRGFHLYRDWFPGSSEYVILEVNGVPFEAVSADLFSGRGVNSVIIRLPNEWARKLGLIED